jgi:hypothetical protein
MSKLILYIRLPNSVRIYLLRSGEKACALNRPSYAESRSNLLESELRSSISLFMTSTVARPRPYCTSLGLLGSLKQDMSGSATLERLAFQQRLFAGLTHIPCCESLFRGTLGSRYAFARALFQATRVYKLLVI